VSSELGFRESGEWRVESGECSADVLCFNEKRKQRKATALLWKTMVAVSSVRKCNIL
jgi:hypothetical protein